MSGRISPSPATQLYVSSPHPMLLPDNPLTPHTGASTPASLGWHQTLPSKMVTYLVQSIKMSECQTRYKGVVLKEASQSVAPALPGNLLEKADPWAPPKSEAPGAEPCHLGFTNPLGGLMQALVLEIPVLVLKDGNSGSFLKI